MWLRLLTVQCPNKLILLLFRVHEFGLLAIIILFVGPRPNSKPICSSVGRNIEGSNVT